MTSVYRATEPFPRSEQFGLTTQVRRAALSVPSNIAEGKGRRTKRDYAQFLYRARGSLYEVETQLEAARNLDYLTADAFNKLIDETAAVARVLNSLIAAIENLIRKEEEIESSLNRRRRSPRPATSDPRA